MDPRPSTAEEMLAGTERLISVASGKGGVGKSMVSSTAALILSKQGYKVGLLDLDFHGPSAHVILGAKGVFPKEDKGIIPPPVHGIKLMSLAYFIGDRPAPLRGSEVSNAMLELLAITRWGQLDFLIVDMPPGIGDEVLEVVKIMKNAEFLVVTTPSKVAWATVQKLIDILKELKVSLLGTIENMNVAKSSSQKNMTKKVPLLGKIGFDKNLEGAIGNPKKLLKTSFACELEKVLARLFGTPHQ